MYGYIVPIHQYHPCWVKEELRSRRLQPLMRSTAVEKRVLCVDARTHTVKQLCEPGEDADNDDDDDDEEEELRRRRLQPLLRSTAVENGVICVDARTRMQNGLCEQGGEEEEEQKEKDAYVDDSKQLSYQENCAGATSYVALLKTCAQQKDLGRGRELHHAVVENGLLVTDPFIGSTLINMYAKCGFLSEAQDVFDELPFRNVVSWTSLITGYALGGHSEEALCCYERMQRDGFSPDRVTFLSILKACGSLGAVDKSQQMHAQILKGGLLENDTSLGTALVDVYSKCGLFAKAQEVFDTLEVRDVVSWNTLITGYAYYRHGEEALNCLEQMQHEGLLPNAVTFTSILKACSILGALDKGQEIHAKVVREGLLVKDMTVINSLVDMYAKCGVLMKAKEVFDELPARNSISWNTLITGHTQSGQGEEALKCFERMQLEGLPPDAFTFSCTLKACGIIGMADKGQQLHAEITREGLFDKNFMVSNALLDMYAKCGLLAEAQDIFDSLLNPDVISWSALIVGYAKHGHNHEALNCFDQMLLKGSFPNTVTLLGILKACGNIGAVHKGQEVHAEIVKDELLEKEIVVGTALVDMYARCGMLPEAQHVFDELSCQDVIAWNALIAGYSQHVHGDEDALSCFEQMQLMGFFPDLVTFVCVLKACGSIGAVCKAQELHDELVRDGLLEMDLAIGNSLIDMYASVGMLTEAESVLKDLPCSDVVSWNALLAGYAQLGDDEVVFDLYDKMALQVKEPDLITFTIVLNTCSHRGLLNKGQLFFETMSTCYGILPTVEHHACMVDLFGRAGHAEEVVAVIKECPFAADVMVWNSLLGACQKQGDMKLGRWVCEHVPQFGGMDSTVYVCMSNFYSAGGRLGSVHQTEASMEQAMMLPVD